MEIPLYPFQVETKDFMVRSGSCLNASFCGSGKTITTLAAIHELGLTDNLIICPKSVLYNWLNEIKRWLGNETPVFVATGTPKARKDVYRAFSEASEVVNGLKTAKYLITTYDTLRSDEAYFIAPYRQWGAVVLDEVHYCVNVSSKRFKACRALKAQVKFGATATPIMNKATDMYGCISAVRGPVLGNYYGFINRYCVKGGFQDKQIMGYRNLDELATRCAPYIIRKTLEDAQFQLPEKTETDLIFELSPEESSLYDRMRKELLFELQAAEVSKLSSPVILNNTLTKLLKLQELTDSCELLGDGLKSSKIEELKEHLMNNLDCSSTTSKAVIFTRFSRMAEILARELAPYGPLLLTGDTQDRQSLIDRFNKDPAARLFISTEAGGAGINLQTANLLYNFDLPFSLGKQEQRTGRIYRHGQDKPTFIYNLIAQLPGGKQTVDLWVKKKLLAKQEISDQLLISDVKELLE